MKKKFDYREFLNKLLFSPRALILLLFGLGGSIWFVIDGIISNQTVWDTTTAELKEINLFDRVRNKKTENFLKITYAYIVNKKGYELYDEYILTTDDDSEKKIEKVKKEQRIRTIYYNRDNPNQGTFNLKSVTITWGQILIGATGILCLSLFAYGVIQTRYDYYYEESDRIF